MEKIEDGYALSTGKEIHANCSILGISPKLSLYGGYDEIIEINDGCADDEPLTLAERKEIAEYAIGLWKKFSELE